MASWRDSLSRALGLPQRGAATADVVDSIPANPNALAEGQERAFGGTSPFANFVSGIGTARDASFWDTWTRPRTLNDEQRRYMGRNALIRNNVLELYPRECTREGWRVQVDEDVVSDPAALAQGIAEYEARDTIAMQATMAEAMARALQYGEALVLLGVDDGQSDWAEPVGRDKIATIHWAKVIDRRDYNSGPLAGPDSLHFGEPDYYDINDLAGILPDGIRNGDQGRYSAGGYFAPGVTTSMRIHRSRVLRFVAQDALSILDAMQDTIGAFLTGANGVTTSLREHSVGVWKLKNWFDTMLSSWREHALGFVERANRTKSTINAIVVDTDKEDFSYVNRNVSGVGDLLNPIMVWWAAATRTPVTVQWGVSPGGFGTGESERATFHENVGAWQKAWLSAPLAQWVDLVLLAKDGPTRGQWIPRNRRTIVFADLEPSDEIEQQDLIDKQIETIVRLVEANLITADEAIASLPQSASFAVKIDDAARAAAAAAGAQAKIEPMAVSIFTALLGDAGLLAAVKQGLATPEQARALLRTADPDRFSDPAVLAAIIPDAPAPAPVPAPPVPGAVPPAVEAAAEIEPATDEPDPLAQALSTDPLPNDTAPARVIADEISLELGHKWHTGRITRWANEGRVRRWNFGGPDVFSRADVRRALAERAGVIDPTDRLAREGDDWLVLSGEGEELGRYATEREARERLRQIEAAKKAKAIEPDEIDAADKRSIEPDEIDVQSRAIEPDEIDRKRK